MSPEARRWLEIALMVMGFTLSGIAAYYNMDARVLLVEQQVKIESAARQSAQAEIRSSLDKFEVKMDRVNEKMDQLTRAFYERGNGHVAR